MNITCRHCQSTFTIPDEKIPKEQILAAACPKCQHRISIDTREPVAAEMPQADQSLDEIASGSYDASEKPFDFIEEGIETALLCESDSDIRDTVGAAMERMGYQVQVAQTAIDALKKMRFHVFDLVVLNDMFGIRKPDENNVLRFLDRLSMDVRRNIFVALITTRFRTGDSMAAFNKSVDLIINMRHIDDTDKILRRGITEKKAFYRVFRESLVKTGRA